MTADLTEVPCIKITCPLDSSKDVAEGNLPETSTKRTKSVSDNSLKLRQQFFRCISAKPTSDLTEMLKSSRPTTPATQNDKPLDHDTNRDGIAQARTTNTNENRNEQRELETQAPRAASFAAPATNPWAAEAPSPALRKSHSHSHWTANVNPKLISTYPNYSVALCPTMKIKKERAIIKSRAPVGALSPPNLTAVSRSYVLEKRETGGKVSEKTSPEFSRP